MDTGRKGRRTPHLAAVLVLALSPLLMAAAVPTALSGASSEGLVAFRQSASEGCVTAPLGSNDPELEALIREVLGDRVGHYGVVAHELEGGTGAAVNPDGVFSAASLFKLPIMYEAFHQREAGRISFGERMTVTQRYAAWDLGTLAGWAAVGHAVPVQQLVEKMIVISDNASAIMLADRLGWHQVQRTMEELGLCGTTVPASRPSTTAADMAALLLAIADGGGLVPQANAEMEQVLLGQGVRDRIPAGVPQDVAVGNKTANLPDATHDVAIVYTPNGTYVLAVLSDRAWQSAPIVELSRAVYDYYSTRLSPSPEDAPSSFSAPSGRFLFY